MEFQFQKTTCSCLKNTVSQVRTQEQTQEVRLNDGMPDIGRIVGCWGQPMIRSKEWRGDSMQVSGGVMAFVLYATESSADLQNLEVWIPFQMKWEFPQTQRDGQMTAIPTVKSMDARTISARKVMVRACISILGQAREMGEWEIFQCGSVPEDVELRKEEMLLELPGEAGEKQITAEEELVPPDNTVQLQKLLRYQAEPVISETKIMAGRLVFKGECRLHLLCSKTDGKLNSYDFSIPFSQYTDLDREYAETCSARMYPVVTGAEAVLEEGKIKAAVEIAAQYVIYDRQCMTFVTDGYSNHRNTELKMEELSLPARLDSCSRTVSGTENFTENMGKVIDTCAYTGHPDYRQTGDQAEISLSAMCQVLYEDREGTVQMLTLHPEAREMLMTSDGNISWCYLCSGAGITVGTGSAEFTAEIQTETFSGNPIPMASGLELGELIQPDPDRPSLIVRKAGTLSLWEIARMCGSTVEAIEKANTLPQTLSEDTVLLIPVS